MYVRDWSFIQLSGIVSRARWGQSRVSQDELACMSGFVKESSSCVGINIKGKVSPSEKQINCHDEW